jgi:hypothetical protein
MQFEFLLRCCGLLTVGFLLGIVPAEGSLITFTSRTAFEAASTGLTTVSFEGIVPADAAQNFPNPDGLTTDGVTFRTSGTGPFGPGHVTVYGADLAAEQSPVLNTGTGAILVWGPPNQPGTAYLDVWLPPGRTAFATDMWAQQPYTTTVRAIVNSGEATENFDIGTMDRPTSSFFGVTSDANTVLLVRLSIPAGQVGLVLDNVSVGIAGSGPTPIPEPGTVILVCAGLAGLTILKALTGIASSACSRDR